VGTLFHDDLGKHRFFGDKIKTGDLEFFFKLKIWLQMRGFSGLGS
jgi:hypothetical protein